MSGALTAVRVRDTRALSLNGVHATAGAELQLPPAEAKALIAAGYVDAVDGGKPSRRRRA